MSRGTLKLGVGICLSLGVADLGLINLVWGPRLVGEPRVSTAPSEPAALPPKPAAAPLEPAAAPAPRPSSAPVAVALATPAATRPSESPVRREEPAPASAPTATPPPPPARLLFATGSSDLDAEAKQVLDRLVERLRGNREQIVVEGHTDQRGSLEVNRRISRERAIAVVAYLRERGVTADRIRYRALGQSQPVDRNNTPEAWRRNRRAEIRISRTWGGGR